MSNRAPPARTTSPHAGTAIAHRSAARAKKQKNKGAMQRTDPVCPYASTVAAYPLSAAPIKSFTPLVSNTSAWSAPPGKTRSNSNRRVVVEAEAGRVEEEPVEGAGEWGSPPGAAAAEADAAAVAEGSTGSVMARLRLEGNAMHSPDLAPAESSCGRSGRTRATTFTRTAFTSSPVRAGASAGGAAAADDVAAPRLAPAVAGGTGPAAAPLDRAPRAPPEGAGAGLVIGRACCCCCCSP